MQKHPNNPGPTPAVTLQLVQRVSKRLAQGIPLRLALAGEPVRQQTYERYLRRHPKLARLQDVGKRRFLEKSIKRLTDSDSLQNLRWLLERRHSDLFGRPLSDPEFTPRQTIINIGSSSFAITEDMVGRAQKLARETSPAAPAVPPSNGL